MRLFHTTQSAERILAEGFRGALLNRYAQVRLLDQAEVDALPKIAILSDKSLGRPTPAHASAPARVRLFSHPGSL